MRQKAIVKIWVAIFLMAAFSFSTFSQNPEEKTTIKWSGLVNVDYMFDSRQTVAAREGHFLLFPFSGR